MRMDMCARSVFGGLLMAAAALMFPTIAQAAGNSGSFVLTAHSMHAPYAPTFTGNGLLGIRVPPAGQGYAAGTVPAQSELAGFYATPDKAPKASERVQQRANIPTWSTLSFSEGGATFSPKAGGLKGWRQSVDLHTGVITTTATWVGPDRHVTNVVYRVFTDRGREHVGVVQLTLAPQWSGTATVSDELDGTADRVTGPKLPPVLTTQGAKSWDLPNRREGETVQAMGTGIAAALADQLVPSANITAPSTAIDQAVNQSVGQRISFPVTDGQSYTLTKYVGIEDSNTSADPASAARNDAAAAATAGFPALLAENDAAWAKLWQGRIDVSGNRTVATNVNASQFYLWSSTRDDQAWSVSPAGLSSNGYDGHIFWDAETWMFPSLLAQHPELAAQMDAYRFNRLAQARRHATATGAQGARFPWESALEGTEQIPPPVSVNSEGLYEQHITADIALAQWQYFVATGDTAWLRTRGWPVIQGAAQFWASRAVRGTHGSYHIDHVTGPDEENPNVNDEAFTNAGARATLQIAASAGKLLGQPVPAAWTKIARGLVVAVRGGVHPEFASYQDQLVKQADVTLLPYQWRFPMSKRVEQADLNFYVPRTDPGGPSMDDAVSLINTAALGTPGCASFVFTQRSYEPFIKDPFDQFSETKTGGAFTFMTGIGGFLQEFLYGYSGLRWGTTGAVTLAPSLNAQLRGVTLRNLRWRGRTFTVAVGDHTTTVTLTSGPALPLATPAGRRTASVGHPVTLRTARPDLRRTSDAVRCGKASATSAEPGAPALAAVDGSPATDWQPASLPATVTAAVAAKPRMIRRAQLVWGHWWPAQPKPNVHPKPRPVTTLSATSFALQTSANGRTWHTAIDVHGLQRADFDRLSFTPVRARYVRLRMTQGNTTVTIYTNGKKGHQTESPMLQEMIVS
jgi:trehalose/maltose hydrolase-like predicted phosphorylase